MDDTQRKIEEIIDLHTITMREQYIDVLEGLLESCESPIEKVFGAALLHDLSSALGFRFIFVEDKKHFSAGAENDYLLSQYVIGPYRVDFCVIRGPLKIAIECDGHDFHERTKEQARKDRSKDRWLQSHGYHVLRFTGSEIWKDPVDCAEQVLKLIWNRILAGIEKNES